MRKLPLYLVTSLIVLIFLDTSAYQGFAHYLTGEYSYKVYLPLVRKPAEPVWHGPYGGYIVSVAIDPTNSQILYAGTWGAGVFKSIDSGSTWTEASAGLNNLYINSLAIDPQNPQVLYAGTYRSKLFKSTNGGQSWFSASTGIQDQAIVYSIAVDPRSSGHIYAATRGISNNGTLPWNGVVYQSIDGGVNWMPSLYDVGGDDYQDWSYSLAFDPTDGARAYAAMHELSFKRTTDGGKTWDTPGEGPDDPSGRAVLVDTNTPTTIYFGSWHGGGVFRSDDRGDTWVQKTPLGILLKVYALALDPQQTKTIYLVSFTDGIFKTIDRGENWVSKGLSSEILYSIAVDPKNSSNIFTGSAGNGFFKSANGGTSWIHSQTGLRNSSVTGLVFSPSNPDEMVASTFGGGVWHSLDHGATWMEFSTGLGDLAVSALLHSSDQPSLLFALTSSAGLYRRVLGTDTAWSATSSGLPLVPTQARQDFSTWDALEDPFAQAVIATDALAPLLSMSISSKTPTSMILGTDGMGVYRSTNGGGTWIYSGLSGNVVRSVVVDPANTEHWYAATSRTGGIYVTSTGGSSYQFIPLPDQPTRTFNVLMISPSEPGAVYAGTDSGIYRLENNSWKYFGLTSKNILALGVHPTLPNQVYVGASSGVYYSWDYGMSWGSGPTPLASVGVQAISFDPAIISRVFFGTQTHGSLSYIFGF